MKNWMQQLLMGGGAAVDWWRSGGISSANAIAAYQPKGAASLAASYTNLANPGTYNAAPGTAPTWSVGAGWIFNGSTQYLTTGIVPGAGWSLLARFSNGGVDATLMGSYNSSNANSLCMIIPGAVGGTKRQYRNGTATGLSISGGQTGGVMGFAAQTAYLNGSAETGTISGSLAGAIALFIGARNNLTGANTFFPGNIQAVAIYNSTLTGPQMAAVSSAMAAL